MEMVDSHGHEPCKRPCCNIDKVEKFGTKESHVFEENSCQDDYVISTLMDTDINTQEIAKLLSKGKKMLSICSKKGNRNITYKHSRYLTPAVRLFDLPAACTVKELELCCACSRVESCVEW